MSPTYHYRQLSCVAKRRIACPSCGKKMARQRTFTNTVNPFNRNEDGTVRTTAEVWANVRALAEAWQPADELCGRCLEAAS